jgi:hypothetical protein
MSSTVTLGQYITECRQLLHDATGAFYTDQELTGYINQARYRLARDTGCLRQLQQDLAIQGQEVYTFATLSNGANTFDVLNINLYWGNTRVPLRYLPWTQFNAELRFWQNYVGRPIAFSMYGSSNSYYISPVPDQDYQMELDTIVKPEAMTNTADVDTIPDVFTGPVAFYACHQAKYKEQAYGESEIFKQEYIKRMQNVLATTYTRRIPNPYSTPY